MATARTMMAGTSNSGNRPYGMRLTPATKGMKAAAVA
jgi:hypothetical protein